MNRIQPNFFFVVDIDECQIPELARKCVENAECCNLPAEYVCKCKPGFEGDGQVECRGESVKRENNTNRVLPPSVLPPSFHHTTPLSVPTGTPTVRKPANWKSLGCKKCGRLSPNGEFQLGHWAWVDAIRQSWEASFSYLLP